MAEFDFTGQADVINNFRALKNDIQYKGGRSSLRKAANFGADKVRDSAKTLDDPQSAEDISKNVAVRWSGRRFRSTGDLSFRIGILGGARRYADDRKNRQKGRAGKEYATAGDKTNPGGDTYYWRFLEHGTKNAQPHKFFVPAIERNVTGIIDTFFSELQKSIARAIKKGG